MMIPRWERPICFAVSLLLLGLWLRPVAAQLLGPEFQVNSHTIGAQYSPAVAAYGSGNFVVVWEGNGLDGSDYGVVGRRFDSLGVPVGSVFQVNSFTTSAQRRPAVAADDSGNFVVVWNSFYQDGSIEGVFGQRFNSAGNPVGTEFQVNTYTTSSQEGPKVAAVGSGNFVVVWNSYMQDGSISGLFGQRFDSAGSPQGNELQVNSYTTGGQYLPEVAADGTGSFVVTWTSYGQDASSGGVFGQRFSSAGSPVGGEFQVNTYTTNGQVPSAVAADGLGNFVVAWTSYRQDGSTFGVFGQRLFNWILMDGFEAGDACAWSAAVGGGCP